VVCCSALFTVLAGMRSYALGILVVVGGGEALEDNGMSQAWKG
jgi:hypothetical protein